MATFTDKKSVQDIFESLTVIRKGSEDEAELRASEDEKVWGSMVKQALKRRKPGFSESFYGFRSFNGLLEEAERLGALKLERDEKSGGYVVRLQSTPD